LFNAVGTDSIFLCRRLGGGFAHSGDLTYQRRHQLNPAVFPFDDAATCAIGQCHIFSYSFVTPILRLS
jgi:hypothetical protein